MKINVIGTSCTWFKRKNTSYLIDDKIVLDTPSGAYKDIIKLITIDKISAILISHFHTDHFADLTFFTTRFMREYKNKKFKIYGPKGVLQKLISLNLLLEAGEDEVDENELTKNIEFIELYDGFEFFIDEYKIKSFKMQHGKPETFGFSIENNNGLKVSFSADTEMCENLENILSDSNYAFVEMASVEKRPNHLSIEEFENLIKRYPNCKIYPVHTSDKCQKYAEDNNMNYLCDGQILNLKK